MSKFGTVLPPRDHVISDCSALRGQQFRQSTCKGCDLNYAVTAAANLVLLRKTARPRLVDSSHNGSHCSARVDALALLLSSNKVLLSSTKVHPSYK